MRGVGEEERRRREKGNCIENGERIKKGMLGGGGEGKGRGEGGMKGS